MEKGDPNDHLGQIGLCVTALLKSGLPSDHEVVTAAFEKMSALPSSRIYSIACYVFAIDAYWQARYQEWSELPREERAKVEEVPRVLPEGTLRDKMAELVKKLQNGTGGTWNYDNRGKGDLSNTQFAVLGLEVALQHEFDVPTKLFHEVATRLIGLQLAPLKKRRFAIVYKSPPWKGVTDGEVRTRGYAAGGAGWAYSVESPGRAKTSMTAAALSSLVIARRVLRDRDAYPDDLAREVDQSITRGLGWIVRNVYDYKKFYDLYSLEKVGDLAGITRIGKVDWYQSLIHI